MNATELIQALERFPQVLEPLISGLPDALWRRKPAPQVWSILEIVCHLRDEERMDFRQRLKMTLEEPEAVWPSINPVATATDQRYNEQVPIDVVREFLAEREDSIKWLKGLKVSKWTTAYEHPQLGAIRAGDLLAAWAAHDLLHLRQITKRHYESVTIAAGMFTPNYAGQWSESN